MEEPSPMQPTTDSQKETLEAAVTAYEVAALVSDEVAAYLRGRGIEEQTARTFRLGVVEEPEPGTPNWHRGKLVIPYLHHSGYPLTIRFRCLEDHKCRELKHGKYMGLDEQVTRMFNTKAVILADDTIHVTEGEFDAMILEQCGYHAIAIPGARTWKPHYRTLLAGFQNIHVWGDPDDAGAEFVTKVTTALPRAKPVRLRDGDVTETYLAGGSEAIAALLCN